MNYLTLGLKKCTQFKGVATRKEYWYFTLFNGVILIFLQLLAIANNDIKIFEIIYSTYGLWSILAAFALISRRLHDTGNSFWNFFLILIPLVGPFWLIFLLASKTKNDNKFV